LYFFKPKFFFLENVASMKMTDRDEMTRVIGEYLFPKSDWTVMEDHTKDFMMSIQNAKLKHSLIF